MPYLILRPASGATRAANLSVSASNDQPWQDISFLETVSDRASDSQYSVQKAHISIVVTGSDHFKWTGYAFANTGVGELVFDDDEEYDIAEEDDMAPDVDYFASDGQGEVLLTESMIQDPRRYWLRVVGLRMTIVLKEWDYIVHKSEHFVRFWVGICSPSSHLRVLTITRTLNSDQLCLLA